jgi:hypothetical protein
MRGRDRPFSIWRGAELKRRNGVCIVEIRDRSNGKKIVIGEDGRTK